MLAGNSRRDYSLDLMYNADPETLRKIQDSIAKIVHAAKSDDPDSEKMRFVNKAVSKEGLANLYNAMIEGRLNDGFTTDPEGYSADKSQIRAMREALEDIDSLARMYSDDESAPFEKMAKALELYTSQLGQATKEEKKQQEEAMENRINTCSEENNPYGAESTESEIDPEFKQVVEWLKSLNTTNNKKKVFKQMEKMSDIQKISAVEFAKPKMLFMKKLVSKDFWFRGETKADRYLHCITDFSGSMGHYNTNRNTAWQLLFNKCTELGISIENTMFNDHLDVETKVKWDNQTALDKSKKLRPDGDDNLGRATVEKLNLITKKKEKQYLIAVSDGTGSFSGPVQSENAKRLATEKNVELKFILFSKQNEMHTIPEEDIFYIY